MRSPELNDVGTAPYSVLRPILLKIDNATQLRQLEIASPHLEVDDGELWIRLIERDFRVLSKKHNFEPRNPTSWHKIYEKYRRLEAENKAAAEEKLKSAMSGIKKEKETNVSQIMDFDRRKMALPPRDIKNVGGSRSKGGRRGGSNDTGELRFTGGTRTKTTSAKSILNKARREAKEIQARNRLATPTGLLPVRQGQIMRAPKGMVNEARVKAQPPVKIQAPRPRQPQMSRRDPELEEREARLRKMKLGSSAPKKNTTYISDSDLEDYEFDEGGYESPDDIGHGTGADKGSLDVDDLENLFGEEEVTSSRKPYQSASAASASKPQKRSGLLSNAPGSSQSNKVRVINNAPSSASPKKPAGPSTAKTTTSSHQSPTLPPQNSHSSPPLPATSPDLKPQAGGPMLQRKRKPVDIFMKPKAAKAPRR